jgi:signal transduction histidine kinase/FixJ family two-component response regulator
MLDADRTMEKTETSRILVIDDEEGLRDFLTYELGALGYSVESAAGGEEGLRKLKAGGFGLVISDVRMPGMDGITLLDEIKRTAPRMEVVLTTGYGTVETAVEAMKRGAFDFLLKPVETDRLSAVVRRALDAAEHKALIALYESSLALFHSVELDEVLPVVVDLSRRLLSADRALILLIKEDGRLRVAADTAGASCGDGFGARVAAACEPGADDSRGLLVQPLTAGGEVLGYLAAARTAPVETFTAHDRRHAALFASQAAQALRNAELFSRLQTTQNSLIRSEKLNAMGRVVAGIAHEINNPLAVIMGNAQMILAGGRVNGDDRTDLQGVVEHARRCRDIVRNLLEFAGGREQKKEALELVSLVEISVGLALCGWSGPPAIVQDWPKVSPRVLADAVQLKQVVVNLVRNALQAVEGRRGAEVAVRVEANAGRARIVVDDRGPGLTAQSEARLFEPFFTTKPPGKGTGLGLYLCRLLVERHGGRITAGNRAGGGASFVIELPAIE